MKKFTTLRLYLQRSDYIAPLSFLLILSIFIAYKEPAFLTIENIKDIARQTAVVAILGCGQTIVILSGNIDLSVGINVTFVGCVIAVAMRQYQLAPLFAICLGVLGGGLVGALNGGLIAFGKIPAFIVTLGSMLIWKGVALTVSGSQNISIKGQIFDSIGAGGLGESKHSNGIPYAFIIMIVVAAACHWLLKTTRYGRAIYAVGGNRESARLSGISLTRMTMSVMTLCGITAGIAGLVDVSRAGVASPTAVDGMELWAIAASVIGGTSLYGGVGGIPGTIIGAFLMSIIRNGCNLHGLDQGKQFMIVGTVIVLAVLNDRARSKHATT